MMTTRRSIRSAGLLAAAAAAAFSLTACQSGGSAAAATTEQQVSSPASPSAGDGGAIAGSKTDADKTGASVQADESTASQNTGSQNTASQKTAPSTTSRSASPIHTQTLPDGSKAEIYKLGDEHYRAKIVHNGELFTTLETAGHDAGIDANDMFIVLTLGGDLHAWMGGDHNGPGTFKLAGGWTAKVTKQGDSQYRAQILGNQGEVDATLNANGHDVGLDANGVYIVLSFGGVISAHA